MKIMSDEEDIEGMFTLVGSPDNPDLEESDLSDSPTLTDRAEQISEEKKQEITHDEGFTASIEEIELAEKALETARLVARQVTPFRVILATVFMAALMFSVFAIGFWAVPRDAVSVEVAYLQGGPGQVVLLQVHNLGSRGIGSVNVEAEFQTLDGEVLNSTRFTRSSIPAHTSVAGDDLEIMVSGVSVWDEYIIVVRLEYDYYDGSVEEQSWRYQVGEWSSEHFTLKADRHWF